MFLTTLIALLNVFTIIGLIGIINETTIIPLSEIYGMLISAILLVINYLIFIRNQNFKKIIKFYKKNYKSHQDFLIIIYVIISFLLFFKVGKDY